LRGFPARAVAVGEAGFRRLCSLRFASIEQADGDTLASEATVLARLHQPAILLAFDLLQAEGLRILVLAFDGVFTQPPWGCFSVAQPETTSSAARPSASGNPRPDVLYHQTLLLVEGPPEGTVYVNGVPVGPVGEPSLARGCGLRFVRVGMQARGASLRGVRWLSEGHIMRLPCEGRATLRVRPE